MSTVDVSQVPAGLFVTGAIFILLFFSLLSFAILSFFQLEKRRGVISLISGAVVAIVFYIILKIWFV